MVFLIAVKSFLVQSISQPHLSQKTDQFTGDPTNSTT
jgi:hypothetical protein